MVDSPEHKQFLDKNFSWARDNFLADKQLVFRNLLFITSGTFVISVSFLGFLSGVPLYDGWALMLSWVCMALSIGTYMKAILVDSDAEGTVMDEIRRVVGLKTLPPEYSPGQTKETQALYGKANTYLNLTYYLVVCGVGLLLFFALVNFAARQALQDKNYTDAMNGYLLLQQR